MDQGAKAALDESTHHFIECTGKRRKKGKETLRSCITAYTLDELARVHTVANVELG